MLERTNFSTVGQLRAALADLPDDMPVYCQVVGTHHDSGAWNMFGEVGEMPNAQPRKLVLSLSHPEMAALPMFDHSSPDVMDDTTVRYGGTCPHCAVRTELVHRCAPKVATDICVVCGGDDAITVHGECR